MSPLRARGSRYGFAICSRSKVGPGAAFCIVRERGASTGCIDGDGFEKLPEVHGRSGPETAGGAAREPGDLLEAGARPAVVSFLEQEDGHGENAELAGQIAKLVHALLHGVANIDKRADLPGRGLPERMLEHLADLRHPAPALDRRHEPCQRRGVADPAASPAFAEAPEKNQLHVEPANGLHRVEHVRLDGQRHVPGWPAAHGRIHGKNQPPFPRCFCGRGRAHLGKKRVDLGPARVPAARHREAHSCSMGVSAAAPWRTYIGSKANMAAGPTFLQ